MISFDAGTHQFHLRAAAVVAKHECVLLHQLEGDSFWALPGGRVEPGETAAAAITREFQEELGIPVQCGELLWVVENFFSYADKPHHELGLYFEVTPEGGSILESAGPFIGTEGSRSLKFAWFDRARLAEIDLRPSFLIDALANGKSSFTHVVQRDLPSPSTSA